MLFQKIKDLDSRGKNLKLDRKKVLLRDRLNKNTEIVPKEQVVVDHVAKQ
jgi:hypothetical protein